MKTAISSEERARRLTALGVRPAAFWAWTDADIVRGERRLSAEIKKINATPIGTIEQLANGKTRHMGCQYPQEAR